MTRADRRSDAGSVPARRPGRPDCKAALICPRCDHTSPVHGDWILVHAPEGLELRCPACRERLATRPDRLRTR